MDPNKLILKTQQKMSHFHRASENDDYFPSLEFWKF